MLAETSRRILLIGSRGQVGWELERALSTLGEVVAVARHGTPRTLDLAQLDDIAPLVEAVRPRWIVNAAAWTAVDQAEREEASAMRINAEAVARLAEAARQINAMLVHYSTDYVFDGRGNAPYAEDAEARPINAYGRSKWLGEQAIREAGVHHLILRTGWVYGLRGHNFMRTIRRLARERAVLRVVDDQRGSPTWSRHLACATAQMLARLGDDRLAWRELGGTYHLASMGETTWFGFAREIVTHQRRHEPIVAERVAPIATSELDLPAPRPAYSVLCTDKAFARFGVRLPHWREALRQVQDELDQERIE